MMHGISTEAAVLPASPAIGIENLTVRYPGGPDLLTGFSLAVQEGECIGIQGESGRGKSTLLHCVCGLIPRSIKAEMRGAVRLSGKPVGEFTRHELVQTIGIVFQNPETQLFCDTVEDEIAFGLENICLPRAEMAARIDACLALTGLERHRLDSPKRLSGGQKQLVALAAVLALRPRILLFDEAFSQLDGPGRERLLMHVLSLRDSGRTVVLVDHDGDNLRVAHRVVNLDPGDAGDA
jgi:energy-coupling factor transport system ATP-binding protein